MSDATYSALRDASGEPMKKNLVRRAVVLTFRKSLEISVKNLQVRFLRSLITIGSLVLATAFLSFVLVNLNVAAGLMALGGEDAAVMLTRAGFDIDEQARTVSMSPKERWIIILSLLVCAVGIVNAQLMAVTERFREIGIMKCLGALDSMILRLFMLEATMQGLTGATLGAVFGFLFSMAVNSLRFGTQVWTTLPWSAAGLSLLIAVGVGAVLSLVGVLYPAYVAARMRPVMALKAEH
ncbi:FtsX-like permease family protein [Desulfonatronum thiosulfatophilum]|uniref:FtsX-like permease family protein n=2 Tax=Desulfonatronum thiosulfatophilum TaxID=617002 RepID=A0A1G6AJV9_9BACT|nr:FtsX-like permease family protein [Desulfonatronum thiosulfatophilum]